MSKKSKKKKKAKKIKLKKQLTVQQKTQPVLNVTAQPVLAEQKKDKSPKLKRIAKIKTAIKEKKAAIKGKIKEKRAQIFESSSKMWKIFAILGTALVSLIIQYYVSNIFDPDMLKTNAAQTKTSAQEAYKINKSFDIINTESTNPGYYLATGETDKDIYSFAVKSKDNGPVVLEELVLTETGSIPQGFITNIRLFEGENAISKAEIKKDKFVFKKITSIIQPGVEKKYVVKADVAKEGSSGIRFKLSLLNPTDIIVTVNDDPVYALDTFPFDGAYATIVGWRKK